MGFGEQAVTKCRNWWCSVSAIQCREQSVSVLLHLSQSGLRLTDTEDQAVFILKTLLTVFTHINMCESKMHSLVDVHLVYFIITLMCLA